MASKDMTMTSRQEFIIVGGMCLVFVGAAVNGIVQKLHERRIQTVMSGPVRGNAKSRIFHIPTCPQYNSIDPGNFRTFDTIEEAESAEYREARNCTEAIDLRRTSEAASDEEPESDHPDPY